DHVLSVSRSSQRLGIMEAFFEEKELPPDCFRAFAAYATSSDSYIRQTAARLIADRGSMKQLSDSCRSDEAENRLAGVLAVGFRLTTPPHEPPPKEVPLSYREQSAFFSVKIRYGDEPDKELDLRKLGPVGAFTFAEYWKAIKPSQEQ